MPRPVDRLRQLARLVVVLALSVTFVVVAVEAGSGDSGEGAVAATARSQRLMSLGGEFSCAITNAGTVQCWGNNEFGQLGTGDNFTSTSPRLVAGITGAVELAAGHSHTCVLIHGGSVKCWGLNGSGELGIGSLASQNAPQSVPGLTNVIALAAGGFHTCALISGGTVKCWGQDGSGQLGDGTLGDLSSTPQPVSGLPGGDPVVAITGGESHTCAATEAGHLWCWGQNGFGQLGDNSTTTTAVPVEVGEPGDPTDPMVDVLAVSAGGYHTCAIIDTSGGTAYCWGANNFGQLGHKTPTSGSPAVMEPSKVPIVVQFDADLSVVGEDIHTLTQVTAISGGMQHTCARITGGEVRCWGHNGSSQLGYDWDTLTDDHPTDSTYAYVVPGLTAQAVVAGGYHTCALTSGQAKCWGDNFFGQLGGYDDQVSTPTTVSAVRGASQVAVATQSVCALLSDVPGGPASPYCWGSNANGRLGIGSTTPTSTTVRRPVVGIPTPDTDLRAGNGSFCALPDSGARRCWGLNQHAELGDGTSTDRPTPVVSTHLTGATAYDLGGTVRAASERGTTCKVDGGQAKCWGYNGDGQLGDGTTTDSSAPVTVKWDDDNDPGTALVPLTGVTDVAVGGDHACAIVSGNVWCWGANTAGQLGDNTTSARVGAVRVQQDTDPDPDADDPLSGVTAITAGASHTCALLTSKKVRCWGEGGSGQLGRNSTSDSPQANSAVRTQSPAADLDNVSDLVTGDNHNCVVRPGLLDPNKQSVLCWGENGENQLGDGSTTDRTSAVVTIKAPTGGTFPGPWISDVSAGRSNTCAVLLDTTVSCWGDNTDGQVGDGLGIARMAPVLVGGGASYETNHIPLPKDYTVETTPGTAKDVVVDLDVDDDPADTVTIVSVGDPPLGTATFSGATITYTPDPGCHDDSFSYVVTDGTAQVAAQITVLMNCAPVANPDAKTTAEDTAVDIDVLANDTDEDGDVLVIDATTPFPNPPTRGTATVVGGKVHYVPAADLCGPPNDTFTYRISDGHGHTADGSVVVTLSCTEDGPTAGTDAVSTPEDTSKVINVLGNDIDVDGDPLAVLSVTQPTHGSTSTNGVTVTYSPAPDYCGGDSFTYVVTDGSLTSTGTVNVAVTCAQDSPKANPDSATVAEDGSVLVNVLANDSDPDSGDTVTLTGTIGAPAHGTAVVESGKVRYTPAADYCGPDAFTYVVTDGTLTAVGTVTVTVTCVNDPPVANADAATTPEDTTVHVHVLVNDTDVDGNPLHVGAIGAPAHGTAVLANGTAVAYTPNPNFNGTDSFTYEAVDPSGASSTATVFVTITPVDDPVQLAAVADQTTVWGKTVAVPLSATDLDAEPITFSVVSGPAGSAISGGSVFQWTPSAAQVGVHVVKVRASSGGVNADRTFSVTVDKRATLLTYDGPTSGQLSDAAPLHATLLDADAATTTPVSGKGVGFVLAGATATGTTDAVGGVSALVQVVGSPGVRTLQTSFAGDAAWKASSTSTSFTAAKEGMSVTLGGTQLVTTAGTTATVTYTADLAEESDGTFAGQLAGTQVTFKRLDGSTVCTATASNTVPGQARATCTASQPVGALPVVVTATSPSYTGLSSVGVVTVANTGSGLASGAGRVQGDAFGFQVVPGAKKVAPAGQVVHVVVSGGTAQVVVGSTITSFTTSCTGGNPKVCKANVQASPATVSSVNLTTGTVSSGGSASLVVNATDPDRYAVSITGSVTRTIGSAAAQVVLDSGSVRVGG